MALCEELKQGDLIEIFHTNSEHWAIYVGNGNVVHLQPPSSSGREYVELEDLTDVVGGRPYKVNNYLDHEYEPLPMMEMMHFARWTIGSEMDYTNGLEDNHSKNFVKTLRYGLHPRKIKF